MIKRIFQLNRHSLIARKGPRKYYSVKAVDLENDDSYFSHYDVSQAHTDAEYNEMVTNSALRNYTFAPVYQSLGSENSSQLSHKIYR